MRGGAAKRTLGPVGGTVGGDERRDLRMGVGRRGEAACMRRGGRLLDVVGGDEPQRRVKLQPTRPRLGRVGGEPSRKRREHGDENRRREPQVGMVSPDEVHGLER